MPRPVRSLLLPGAVLLLAALVSPVHAPAPPEPDRVTLEMLGGFVDPSVYEIMNDAQRRMALAMVRRDLPAELPALCFDEESDTRLFSWMHQEWDKLGGFQFSDGSRWSVTATDGSGLGQGDPTTLTWGFVADGTTIGGGVGEPSAPSNLIAFLDGIYGSGPGGSDYTQRPWFTYFQMVFDQWAGRIGVDYVYEPDDDGKALPSGGSAGSLGVRPDIRIGGHYIDGPSDVLAYNYFPNTGDMVIDTGDNFFNTVTQNSRRLRNVVAHEHGHGLGIDHVCPVNQTKLMEPNVTVVFDGVQFDDELAGNRGYGDRDEFPAGNDTPGAATDLGAIALSSVATRFGISIDDNSDADLYAFTVPAGAMATFRVIPAGFVYLQGPELVNGCSAGTAFNAQAQSNLAIELRDTAGTGVIASADAAGPGGMEELTDIVLPDGAGTYYARISGSANAAQSYAMWVYVNPAPQPNQPPTAVCRDVLSCDGNVAPEDVDDGSFDPDDDPLAFTLEPAGPYAPGATPVLLIVDDGDLADTCSATITVECPQGPILELTPAAVTFPTVAWGDTACAKITLRNAGDEPMDVISITGCDAGGFLTVQDAIATPVAPGDSTCFQVCFTPLADGPDSCTVTVVTGDSTAAVAVQVGAVTSVPGDGARGPLAAGPAFPNPFRADVRIGFTLDRAAPVRATVFDLRGRAVRELARGETLAAGSHVLGWDGRDASGVETAAGIYLIRVVTPEASAVVRAVRSR